jgi:hypothetical protein
MKRPSEMQRRILLLLARGARIEDEGRQAVLRDGVVREDLRKTSYGALREQGWLTQTGPRVWGLSQAGRKALEGGAR